MSCIMPREAYIANTRKDTSETSGDSDKLCNSFIQVKFTYKAMSDVEGLPSRTHTHAHARVSMLMDFHAAVKVKGP